MPFEFNETALIAITTPLYIVVIVGEILLSHWRANKFYTLKGTLLNIYLSLINGSIDLLFRAVYIFIILEWFYHFKLFNFQDHPVVYWLLLFISEDFVFYIQHRVDDYCRIFWAVHVTHHSSEEFNLTTGFRSSVFQPIKILS